MSESETGAKHTGAIGTVRGGTFVRFVEVIAALRNPIGGCPWDLEQTHSSIRPYLVEETYEVLEAIDSGSDRMLCEELGDLLLQVVLHAQIAQDRGAFTIDDVTEYVTEKMIRRHPHVFGETAVSGTLEVLSNWESIKAKERQDAAANERPAGSDGTEEPPRAPSLLDGIPKELPSLLRAQRTGEKATRVHFDWDELPPVRAKLSEEIAELDAVIATLPQALTKPLTTAPKERDAHTQLRLESEIGDVLFSVCQLARWLGVSAEDALRGTISRFHSRFRWMESAVSGSLGELGPEELENLWQRAKSAESHSP